MQTALCQAAKLKFHGNIFLVWHILARTSATSHACRARGIWRTTRHMDKRAVLHRSRPPVDQSGKRVASWTERRPTRRHLREDPREKTVFVEFQLNADRHPYRSITIGQMSVVRRVSSQVQLLTASDGSFLYHIPTLVTMMKVDTDDPAASRKCLSRCCLTRSDVIYNCGKTSALNGSGLSLMTCFGQFRHYLLKTGIQNNS